MKKITIIFFLFLTVACREEKTQIFDYIDYSFYSTWIGHYSIKIENDGKINMYLKHFDNRSFFIRTMLDRTILDSITNMVKSIDLAGIDSIYTKNCEDCTYSNLILKTSENKYNVFIEDYNIDESKFRGIINLSNYMQRIMSDTSYAIQSIKYESSMDSFLDFVPPPLDDN